MALWHVYFAQRRAVKMGRWDCGFRNVSIRGVRVEHLSYPTRTRTRTRGYGSGRVYPRVRVDPHTSRLSIYLTAVDREERGWRSAAVRPAVRRTERRDTGQRWYPGAPRGAETPRDREYRRVTSSRQPYHRRPSSLKHARTRRHITSAVGVGFTKKKSLKTLKSPNLGFL